MLFINYCSSGGSEARSDMNYCILHFWYSQAPNAVKYETVFNYSIPAQKLPMLRIRLLTG